MMTMDISDIPAFSLVDVYSYGMMGNDWEGIPQSNLQYGGIPPEGCKIQLIWGWVVWLIRIQIYQERLAPV